MKKLYLSLYALVAVTAMLVGATMAWFTATDNAGEAVFTAGTVSIAADQSLNFAVDVNCEWITDSVYPRKIADVQQRLRKNNSAVPANRSDPTTVLPGHPIPNQFFSLGFGGHIAVEFYDKIIPGQTVAVVVEVTGGSYPLEEADVYISMTGEGNSWHYIGTANNAGGGGQYKTTQLNVPNLPIPYARYVKLVDTTDINQNFTGAPADGFDVYAIYVNGAFKCRTMNWNPGDCSEKTYTIENTGSKSIHLKAEFTGSWYEYDDTLLAWVAWTPDPDLDVVTYTLPEGSFWFPGATPGQFYFNGSILIDGSATLTVKVCLAGEDTDDQYQGKRFILSNTFNAIQASNGASLDKWGVTIPSAAFPQP